MPSSPYCDDISAVLQKLVREQALIIKNQYNEEVKRAQRMEDFLSLYYYIRFENDDDFYHLVRLCGACGVVYNSDFKIAVYQKLLQEVSSQIETIRYYYI